MSLSFPDNFIYGAATSSFQIEGSYLIDGAAPSNWYNFSVNNLGIPSEVLNHKGCKHYINWKNDVQLIHELSLNSYRFSVSWPRIIPDKDQLPNSKGLDFYDHLVDELHRFNISPMLTLFHWDLPQHLEDQGGWANPESIEWYLHFVETVADRLADRVPAWITINEPWVFLHLGMIKGIHAPGYKDLKHAASSYKNILMAHSEAVRILRSYNNCSEIGISCNISPFTPETDSREDVEACQRIHDYHNKLFLDAWHKGDIPEIASQVFGKHTPKWNSEELRILQEPIDFIGVNYYTFFRVRYDPHAFLQARSAPPRPPLTDMKWEVYPRGLFKALEWIYNRYHTEIYITENGCAYTYEPSNSGEVTDNRRIDYMYRHLEQCSMAISNGIPLKGYYAWSLLDNFEWTFALNKRFGLIHVDFDTQKRTIKNSGYFYRDFINGKTEKPDHVRSDVINQYEGVVWHDDINFRAI